MDCGRLQKFPQDIHPAANTCQVKGQALMRKDRTLHFFLFFLKDKELLSQPIKYATLSEFVREPETRSFTSQQIKLSEG